MGSWGAKTFDSDDAMDWLHKLYASDDFGLVHSTLSRLAETPSQFAQFVREHRALAAAQVVASWLGHPPAEKQGLDEWVRKHTDWFTSEILALARQSVVAIKTQSELREMWTDHQGVVRAEWFDSVTDLERRLQSGDR